MTIWLIKDVNGINRYTYYYLYFGLTTSYICYKPSKKTSKSQKNGIYSRGGGESCCIAKLREMLTVTTLTFES